MNRKWIYIIITLIILGMSAPVIGFAQETNLTTNAYIPPTLQNLKAKDQFIRNFNEIKRIRNNMYSLNVNSTTAKQNANNLRKEINFYINEFKSVERNLQDIKIQNADSKADVVFAEQLIFTIFSYKLSLEEQLILVDLLVNDDKQGSNLFFSDYLSHIYYYLTLGDQMVSYVDLYYKLQ